ncbi:helix-turn-helix transcriptional regulator [Vibrio sp. HN007]|uniref:helix-turn-helix transcriptional regulator n=1 Tax=Vibrio iocasae TaxID=3098914 RepID=UPI0035D50B0B
MHEIRDFSRVAEREYALSTDSINLLYYDLPKHFNDEYHSYDAPRLCTILEGTKEVSVNQSEKFVYKKDQFILLPPNANVHMSMPEYTKALVYEFGDQIISSVSQQVSDNLNMDLPDEMNYSNFTLDRVDNRIESLHHRMQEILREDDPNMRFLIDITSQELVYELLKKQGCHDIIYHYKNHPINKAIRIMNSVSGSNLKIADVAEEVDMSLSNFSQKFKVVTNHSPKDYITKLKLHKSKKYLNSLSVTDTAYEVGYDNISHFIRLFKKEFGMTPKQYQLKERH